MRNYDKIIEERYDKQKYDGRSIKNNPYSLVNPIGFYQNYKATQVLHDFINMLNVRGKSLDKLRVCDCGCGDGVKTRFLAELLGNPEQVYGMEYSKNRLQHCKNMNPLIHYEYADLIKEIPFDIQFDGITSFTVFMFFASENDIVSALGNIYASLKKKGLFLWLDPNVESHWKVKDKNIDGWGFSPNEMDEYASRVGLKFVKGFKLYSCIPVVNRTTAYMATSVKDIWALELLDKLPFRKNNIVRIYRKE